MEPTPLAGDASRDRYLVGDIVVDKGQRKLWRGNQPLAVTRLTLDLFLTLLERAPNLVTHDEIIERVWGPRRVISPETLTQCVLRLRHALGDDAANPRYIESIRGQGYRLIPPARAFDGAEPEPSSLSGNAPVLAQRSPRRSMIGVAALSTLVALGALELGRITPDPAAVASVSSVPRAPPKAQPHSIAVLPFATSGMDAADALVADGIHADILNELARIADVNVIARATMRHFAATELSVPEIADALNVESVMHLDLRLSEQHLELTAELIDGRTGMQRWFHRYDEHLGNVYALQRNLAANVAEELGAQLSNTERARLQARPTTSAEAYEFFVKAADAFAIDYMDRSMIAQSFLDQAIALDPEFARAYGFKGLIYAYGIDEFTDSADDLAAVHAERTRLALQYADAALAIDPGTVIAHRARAIVGMRSWRWEMAQQAFESALEHSPNDVVSLSEFALFSVCALGERSRLRNAERAIELDPRNPRLYELYGRALNCAEDHESALGALRHSVELDPTNFRRRAMSVYTAARVRPADEVERELRALEPLLTDVRLQAYPPIALTYAEIGRHEDARRIIARFEALNGHRTTNLGNSVFAYLAVGDDEAAYRALERAVTELGPGSGYLTLLAIRDNLRGNPTLDESRFVELRDRIRPRADRAPDKRSAETVRNPGLDDEH